jgi:H+/Cl- antiporter ClcA
LLQLQRFQLLSLLVATIGGAAAGVLTAAFLHALEWATGFREGTPGLIWFLPVAGLSIGLLYQFAAPRAAPGLSLVFAEMNRPTRPLPALLAPLILLTTVITHLFGGSAGREGTAVQLGAGAADLTSRPFFKCPELRRRLLVSGVSAGFASALGTPLAGALFGMEVLRAKGMRLFAWKECLAASFAGYGASILLGAPHTIFPLPVIPEWSASSLFAAAAAGIPFGLVALGSGWSIVLVHRTFLKIPWPFLRPAIGGCVLAAFFFALGTDRYAGLGLQVIQDALAGQVISPLDFLLKGLATAITIGSGFKGGEFVPLVFMGSTVGPLLAPILPASAPFLAALGFGAVFGAAAKTPLTTTLMLCEIFGWKIGPAAVLCCLSAYLASGGAGIYQGQRPGVRLWKSLKRRL